MYYRSDPTANLAIGKITREWNKMAKLVAEIREDPYSEWAEIQRRKFTGIYKSLLVDHDLFDSSVS